MVLTFALGIVPATMLVVFAIGIGLLTEQMSWFVPGDRVLFAAPLVIGCAHLVRYDARAFRRRASA
jgi:hypothetical protein